MDARSLTLALSGRWDGHRGLAPCPICQPERRRDQRALSIQDHQSGRSYLLHCFKSGCKFLAILDALRCIGLLGVQGSCAPVPALAPTLRKVSDEADAVRRAERARSWWNEAQPIAGTPAESYLRLRGIACRLSRSLRFHPACLHPCPDVHERLPAMLARVEGADRFALHRTFLRRDGRGKADVEPAKAMLGGVSGGAVRLLTAPPEADAPLVVAEGIETALSVACLLDQPLTGWATLSTHGMRVLRLPLLAGRLIIAADGEPAGRGAADALAMRALAIGWMVELLPAPDGLDWNDVLVAQGGAS